MSTLRETIETNPYRAALTAGAAACLTGAIPQWWSRAVIPFEEVFAKVDCLADEAAHGNECPETAAIFLLLVREALH